jgi:hypothetical protein
MSVKVMVTVSTLDRPGAQWRSKTLTLAHPTHEACEQEWRGVFADFLHRAVQDGAEPDIEVDEEES